MNSELFPQPPPKPPAWPAPTVVPPKRAPPPPNTVRPDSAAGTVSAESTDMVSPRGPPDRAEAGCRVLNIEGVVEDTMERTDGTDGTMVIPSIKLPTQLTSVLTTSKSSRGRSTGVRRGRWRPSALLSMLTKGEATTPKKDGCL